LPNRELPGTVFGIVRWNPTCTVVPEIPTDKDDLTAFAGSMTRERE
jgi:hypothetical protein